MQSTIETKAHRLLAAGAVHKVHDHVYVVEGDNGRYLVTVADFEKVAAAAGTGLVAPSSSCSCPARETCSHITAARSVQRAEAPIDDLWRRVGA